MQQAGKFFPLHFVPLELFEHEIFPMKEYLWDRILRYFQNLVSKNLNKLNFYTFFSDIKIFSIRNIFFGIIRG